MSKEAEPNNIKSIDMLAVRKYTFNGIDVLIQIDRRTSTVSLVEYSEKQQQYVGKNWLFKDRTIEYAKTWVKILGAMSAATQEAINELEQIESEQLERAAVLLKAANSESPRGDWSKPPGTVHRVDM